MRSRKAAEVRPARRLTFPRSVAMESPVAVHAVIGWRSNQPVVDAPGPRFERRPLSRRAKPRRGDRHRLLSHGHQLRRCANAPPRPAGFLLSAVVVDDGIMTETGGIGGFLVDFQPMSPDDMQRAMQFLLNQQAQVAADFAKLVADSARNEARITEGFGRVNEGLVGLTAIVGQLAASQQRSDERVDELGEYLRSVESHLNVVVDMFDRHLREDHGQRPS